MRENSSQLLQTGTIGEKVRLPSERRNFFKRLFQIAGLAGAAFYSLRSDGAEKTDRASIPEIINVRDWGAAGDGLTDDTAAIQSAINAGKVIYLPHGSYKCTSALILKKNNFKMYGDGELCFEKDFMGGGITIAAHVSNIILDGFSIRLRSNVNGQGFCGIFSTPGAASVVASRLSNLRIYGAAFGINIDGGKRVAEIISETALKAFKAAAGRTMPYMESAQDGRNLILSNAIRDSLFPKRIGTGGAHGIFVRGSGYNIIAQNQIENMQGGILAASEGIVAHNIILNCFEDNGIYCAGSVGLLVQGNLIENTKADGIAFNHSANCSAIGNQVSGAGNASFRIQASHNIVISENVCNSKGVSGGYVRSFIDAHSPDAPSNITIANNHFVGGVDRGNAFAFGAVPIAAPYKNWRVSANHISDVDVSALAGAFFGPYAVVMFGAHKGNFNLVVNGNTFTEVTRCSKGTKPCQYVRNATSESDNVFEHK